MDDHCSQVPGRVAPPLGLELLLHSLDASAEDCGDCRIERVVALEPDIAAHVCAVGEPEAQDFLNDHLPRPLAASELVRGEATAQNSGCAHLARSRLFPSTRTWDEMAAATLGHRFPLLALHRPLGCLQGRRRIAPEAQK